MRTRWSGFRSPLADDIQQFVTAKRALGRRYVSDEKALRMLDAFLVEHGVRSREQLSPELMDRFLASRPRLSVRGYNELLGIVRRLFDWLVRQGRWAHSPVRARPRRQTARRIPFIFGVEHARRLLALAADLPVRSRAPLRGPTYRAIFALMYGLGLRVGEVCRLTFADVDLERHLLAVRGTKFGKSRLVPFGPKMATLLRAYLALRPRPPLREAPVFSFTKRGSIHPCTVSQTFLQLVRRMDLTIPAGVARPRLHDLRHAFAVGTLLRWYRSGVDPAGRLFHLATFMGHVSPSSTAEYLTITSELLGEAHRRFHGLAMPLLGEAEP